MGLRASPNRMSPNAAVSEANATRSSGPSLAFSQLSANDLRWAGADHAQESAVAFRSLRHLTARDKRQQRPGSAGEREKRHRSDQYRAQITTISGEAQTRADGARQTLGRWPFRWLPRRAPP
jgi:hypothetical protein